jgi:hypothetical protein
MNKFNYIATQNNHSLIISYPINYYKFPLAEHCQFIEIDLNENEYVFIPANWMHWVFTEPYNISMNYFINNIKCLKIEKDNLFYQNIKKKIPFKGEVQNKLNLSYKDFLSKNLDNKFSFIYSTTSHCVPIKKPGFTNISYGKFNSLRDFLSSDYKNFFTYIPQNIINDTYLNKLENFIADIDDKILYKSSIWINFDKNINSGLHFDAHDNILINFVGKKKILLAKPDDRKYMYFEVMEVIDLKK